MYTASRLLDQSRWSRSFPSLLISLIIGSLFFFWASRVEEKKKGFLLLFSLNDNYLSRTIISRTSLSIITASLMMISLTRPLRTCKPIDPSSRASVISLKKTKFVSWLNIFLFSVLLIPSWRNQKTSERSPLESAHNGGLKSWNKTRPDVFSSSLKR